MREQEEGDGSAPRDGVISVEETFSDMIIGGASSLPESKLGSVQNQGERVIISNEERARTPPSLASADQQTRDSPGGVNPRREVRVLTHPILASVLEQTRDSPDGVNTRSVARVFAPPSLSSN